MKSKILSVALPMLLFASIATAQVKFDDYFVEKTMRFD